MKLKRAHLVPQIFVKFSCYILFQSTHSITAWHDDCSLHSTESLINRHVYNHGYKCCSCFVILCTVACSITKDTQFIPPPIQELIQSLMNRMLPAELQPPTVNHSSTSLMDIHRSIKAHYTHSIYYF